MVAEKTCEHCQQPFRITRERELARKFCSTDCLRAHETEHGRPAARVAAETLVCKNCEKPFTMAPSYLTAYRKKFGRNPLYCSMPCSAQGRKKDAEERNSFVCLHCGKNNPRKRRPSGSLYYEQKFCNPTCNYAYYSQKAAERFESGEIKRHIKRHGYVWITVPMLSRNGGPKSIMEHRYIMSKHLGRDLFPEETVHHVNGNRQDNRIENLELFSSRHGPGQRVVDKLDFAKEMVRLYPDLARKIGLVLLDEPHEFTAGLLSTL